MKTNLETPISNAVTVKLNMAMSLDGHTVMPGGSWPTSYKEDWRRMNRLRDWADAVIRLLDLRPGGQRVDWNGVITSAMDTKKDRVVKVKGTPAV